MVNSTCRLGIAGILIFLLLFSFDSHAQVQQPVTWKSRISKIEGDEVTVQDTQENLLAESISYEPDAPKSLQYLTWGIDQFKNCKP